MRKLEERIMKDGTVLPGNILKVDRFINHMIDPVLFEDLANEFYEKFKDKKINKILTIEVSGIAIAYACGIRFNCPVVFAKKTSSKTLGDNCYRTEVFSFTKNRSYEVMVSKGYLDENDRVLLIDDFLANGRAALGLKDLIEQAEANLVGVGIVIEKGFQAGGALLKANDVRLESLAVVESIDNGTVKFR
ncbi:MAG: xanthine phosphoribosyltransferase [Clostridioides difficile]|nr:xanthine phosphoribosyltransferase [Clostridioides difficile]